MSDPTLSIAIATYNRVDELRLTLRSLRTQTIVPSEILIVDDSETDAVERLVSGLSENPSFPVRYLRNPRSKGLTVARNVAVEETSGDILLFLDDDVELEPDYLKVLLTFFQEHPDVLGAQGYWGEFDDWDLKDRLLNAFDRLFRLSHIENRGCRVLPNTNPTYPAEPAGPTPCEWLSGANQAYRREVFSEHQFDENLSHYAYKEDVDFSYRVGKSNPDSLYLLPDAGLIHHKAPSARMPSRTMAVMKVAHSLYLMNKNHRNQIGSISTFGIARLGGILRTLLLAGFGDPNRRRGRLRETRYLIEALGLCLRRWEKIGCGDFSTLDGIGTGADG